MKTYLSIFLGLVGLAMFLWGSTFGLSEAWRMGALQFGIFMSTIGVWSARRRPRNVGTTGSQGRV